MEESRTHRVHVSTIHDRVTVALLIWHKAVTARTEEFSSAWPGYLRRLASEEEAT